MLGSKSLNLLRLINNFLYYINTKRNGLRKISRKPLKINCRDDRI